MMSSFSSRLKEAMEKNDMSASELSRISGVGKSDISNYLNGKYLAKQDKVYILAKALGVDPGWLMTGVEPKEEEEVKPQTIEAKILSKGIDKLPKEQREKALAMFQVMFAPQYAELFTKGTDENDT